MQRFWKALAPLSCGGVTLGWLQAAGMINFSNVLTDFLSYLFSAIISAFFGVLPTEAFTPGGGLVELFS